MVWKTYKRGNNLKKNKKIYLEDAQYFIEDVRKSVIETLSYDKVYKQGFNIKYSNRFKFTNNCNKIT